MRSRRKTEITLETSRLVVIKKSPKVNPVWCEECKVERDMVTAEEAAAIACVSTRVIYRWIEQSKLHFLDNREGSLLVCCTSLVANMPKLEP